MKNGWSAFIMSKMVDEKWFMRGDFENGCREMVDERRKNGWSEWKIWLVNENYFSKIGIKEKKFFQNRKQN